MDTNNVFVKRTSDCISCEPLVKEADVPAFSYGVNAENSSKQLMSLDNEAKRLNFESVSIAEDLDIEKDLRSEVSEPIDSNVSVKCTPDRISCEQTVKEADFPSSSFDVNADNCSKQLTSFEIETKRLNSESITFADDLNIEKDLIPKVSETMDDNNKVSVRCTSDITCEQIVKEADIPAFSFGVNAETCLNQLMSFQNEAKRLNFESFTISYDFELEKELRDAKKMYYNELCDFMRTTQGFAQNVKQKCEIKKDIYGSFDNIINGLRSQVEACKDIIPLAATIYDTLVVLNNNKIKHYSDCVIIFAEFLNGFVEVNGFGGAQGVIDKVEINNYSSVNELAIHCLQTLELLKERKSNDPFSEKIAAASRMEDETDLLLDQINAKNVERKVEEERLEVDIKNRQQNIKELKMEITKLNHEAVAIEEGEKAKTVKLIYSNMEKTTSYITMGKKIDEFKMKLGKLPAIEQTYDEVKKRLETSEEKLVLLKNEIENIKISCKQKKAHIEKYEREKEVFNGSNDAHILSLMRKYLAPYMLSFFDSVTMEIHKISDDNQQTKLISRDENDANNVVFQSTKDNPLEVMKKDHHQFSEGSPDIIDNNIENIMCFEEVDLSTQVINKEQQQFSGDSVTMIDNRCTEEVVQSNLIDSYIENTEYHHSISYKGENYKYILVHNKSKKAVTIKERSELINKCINVTNTVNWISKIYSCNIHNGECKYGNASSREKGNLITHIQSCLFHMICLVCKGEITYRTGFAQHIKSKHISKIPKLSKMIASKPEM